MHIALLTPAWPGSITANGITKSVSHLRNGIRECGHHTTIITQKIDSTHSDHDVFCVPQLNWRLVDKLKWRIGVSDVLHRHTANCITQTLEYINKKNRIDVFIMEESFGWAYWISRRTSIPIIVTLRGPWFLHKSLHGTKANADLRREKNEEAGIRSAKGIMAPSEAVLQRTILQYDLSDVPCAVIPNPIPDLHDTASNNYTNERLKKLLFVGRYDCHKGGDIILDMFSLLAEMDPECSLTFVGPDRGVKMDNGLTQNIKEHINKLKYHVQSRIHYVGQQSESEVRQLRMTHGITLIGSRYENFPNVLIEAMSAGAPIICTRVGGTSELLEHNKTGVLVPAESPRVMAEACRELIDKPDIAAALGEAARSFVNKHLRQDVVAEKCVRFIQKVIG